MLTLSWRPNTVSFVRPLRMGRQLMPSREGGVITLHDDAFSGSSEQVFWSPSDAALFDGHFRRILNSFLEVTWPHPEWPWAIAMAAAAYQSQKEGRSVASVLAQWVELRCPEVFPEITSQGFLCGSLPEINAQVHQKSGKGISVFKLKVGDTTDLSYEIDRVKAVCAFLPQDARLRLDANRCWLLESALQFAKALHDYPIDFIEEPLKNPAGLHDFYMKTGMKVALDETIWHGEPWKKFDGCAVVVIKPGAMTFGQVHENLKKAHDLGLQVLISSCFEAELGMGYLRLLAQLAAPNSLAGLDTLDLIRGSTPS